MGATNKGRPLVGRWVETDLEWKAGFGRHRGILPAVSVGCVL